MTAPTPPGVSALNLRVLLEEVIERDASDLHITAGERPMLRIDGDITRSNVDFVMQPKDTLQLAYSVLTENQKKRFETEDELDFSFGIQNLARFRGNCFKQRGCVSMVIRQIPFNIKTFERAPAAEGHRRSRGQAARPDPRDGSDRLRQVDDARGDARQDQQGAEGAHHHDRRSDRVHSQAPELHRQPARSRHATRRASSRRSSTPCDRTPTSC